jgi:hypothetical protein
MVCGGVLHHRGLVGWGRSMVGRGSVDHRGMVGRGRGMVGWGRVDHRCMVDRGGGMVCRGRRVVSSRQGEDAQGEESLKWSGDMCWCSAAHCWSQTHCTIHQPSCLACVVSRATGLTPPVLPIIYGWPPIL